MSFAENTMQASDQRPIRLRTRKDLIISEVIFQGDKSWVVKDPVSLKYVRLQSAEYEVFQELKAEATYDEIKRKLDRKFPDRIVRYDDLQLLISSFHRSGLLVSNSPGQAVPLLERNRKQKRQKLISLLGTILSIKFPGVDPDRFLNWSYPKIRWLFSWTVFFSALLLALSAGFLILNNWGEFVRKLPEFQRFFSAQNILFMGVVLMVTKILHELGHGFFCKHFGGECHEIGFMLLVLTPAMYCNTSDSWILPNKWHRATIGMAGMYVEVILASLCTFVWWYTNPGAIHYFCLNVMFVSGVSTIVFNANPLLRYDGYYIMSDLLEVPNLSQKSRMAVLNKLRVWFLGMEPMHSRFLPQRNQELFAIYSVASVAYRWFVLFAILFFLSKVFEPWGLQSVGQILIVISLIGIIVVPIFKLIKFFLYPGRFRQVKGRRLIFTSVLIASLVYFAGFVPFPNYVFAPVVIRPDNADKIYVTTPGRIVAQNFQQGDQVAENALILRLENPALEFESQQLQTEVESLKAKLADTEFRASRGSLNSATLNEIKTKLDAMNDGLEEKKKKLAELSLKSKRKGVVLSPSYKPYSSTTLTSFGTWSRTPLDPVAKNAFVEPGTEICYIGDPKKMKAIVIVEQDDISFVKEDQAVQIILDEFPSVRLHGVVKKIAVAEKKLADPELTPTNDAILQSKFDADGVLKPLISSYEVDVPLHNQRQTLLPGFRGHAKIRVGTATLFQKVTRYFYNLFQFR